jgi:hypothetical protein
MGTEALSYVALSEIEKMKNKKQAVKSPSKKEPKSRKNR